MYKINFNKNFLKIILIIWIIINPILFLSLYFIANSGFFNLRHRANFFSLPYNSRYINESNSEIIEGDKNKGTVMTSLNVPSEFVKKGFLLKIEAYANRSWSYSVGGGIHYIYPTKNLRIEIVLNNKIEKVLNYTKLPYNLYKNKVSYYELKISNYEKLLYYVEQFERDLSRNEIKIILLTEHKLYDGQDIFSTYFNNDDYLFTICIGEPELILILIEIPLLIIWIISITVFKKF